MLVSARNLRHAPPQVAITVPGDNSVDILTNDVGIVVMSDEGGEVHGYNLLVGGGMGRTARRDALPLHAPAGADLCRGWGWR